MLLRSERCSVPLVFRLRFGPVPSAGPAHFISEIPLKPCRSDPKAVSEDHHAEDEHDEGSG